MSGRTLMSLSGSRLRVGGVGKSRLALRAAADDRPDGGPAGPGGGAAGRAARAARLLGLAQRIWSTHGQAQASVPAWVAARKACE
jgi:hypothetical protein